MGAALSNTPGIKLPRGHRICVFYFFEIVKWSLDPIFFNHSRLAVGTVSLAMVSNLFSVSYQWTRMDKLDR